MVIPGFTGIGQVKGVLWRPIQIGTHAFGIGKTFLKVVIPTQCFNQRMLAPSKDHFAAKGGNSIQPFKVLLPITTRSQVLGIRGNVSEAIHQKTPPKAPSF